MAKKKTQHGLHIKQHTKGSSNEISFSVLDAAKEALEDKSRNQGKPSSSAGGVSLFTLGKGKKPRATPARDQHIVLSEGAMPKTRSSSTASLAPVAPVRHRDHSPLRIVPVIVGLCVVLALALVGLQALQQFTLQQQDYQGQLKDQINAVNEVDRVMIPLDTLVMSVLDEKLFAEGSAAADAPSFDELSESYRAVVGDIAPARTELEDTLAVLDDLQPSLTDNRDEEAAHQATIAARSRLNMMDAGVDIIDMALMAAEAYEYAHDGWKRVIDADALTREATAALKDMTKENVQASIGKSNEAIAAFDDASSLLTSAQSAYPALDLSAVLSYVAKRTEAQQLALEADQAYLDRDKKTLQKKNDSYNKLEEEAAALAQELTLDPDQQVVQLYTTSVEEKRQAYDAERLKAGNADAFLRDYLGSAS